MRKQNAKSTARSTAKPAAKKQNLHPTEVRELNESNAKIVAGEELNRAELRRMLRIAKRQNKNIKHQDLKDKLNQAAAFSRARRIEQIEAGGTQNAD
jgi:hypothetical protein